jgi:hypothetical protein
MTIGEVDLPEFLVGTDAAAFEWILGPTDGSPGPTSADPPDEEELGFRWVESGPLVRSSYHADGQARLITRNDISAPAQV